MRKIQEKIYHSSAHVYLLTDKAKRSAGRGIKTSFKALFKAVFISEQKFAQALRHTGRFIRKYKASTAIAFYSFGFISAYALLHKVGLSQGNVQHEEDIQAVKDNAIRLNTSLAKVENQLTELYQETQPKLPDSIEKTVLNEAEEVVAKDEPEAINMDEHFFQSIFPKESMSGTVEQLLTLEGKIQVLNSKIEKMQSNVDQRKEILASTPTIPPVHGWITSGFGKRKSPFSKKWEVHYGIDISAAKGALVVATADGIVESVSSRPGFGKAVFVDHGFGMKSIYAHNGLLLVKEGQKVKRGQPIAKVGLTGRTTGPHVHYEVKLNDKSINPWEFITYDANKLIVRPKVQAEARAKEDQLKQPI